jgi:hypothetical protein
MATSIPTSDNWAKKVCKALGIDDELVYRLVIDCQVGDPIRVYVQMYGSDRMLEVATPSTQEVDIHILEKPGVSSFREVG